MLTTSNDEEDKIEAFNLNVAGYMLKSDIGQSFIKAVELIDNYWRVMELPHDTHSHMATGASARRAVVNADSRGML
jgi:DNA-binding NarL/FixJ family response regulator